MGDNYFFVCNIEKAGGGGGGGGGGGQGGGEIENTCNNTVQK